MVPACASVECMNAELATSSVLAFLAAVMRLKLAILYAAHVSIKLSPHSMWVLMQANEVQL